LQTGLLPKTNFNRAKIGRTTTILVRHEPAEYRREVLTPELPTNAATKTIMTIIF